MLISRTLARHRIQQGHRPGWLAAWGPVIADAAMILGLLGLLWGPLMAAIYAWQPPLGLTVVLLFVVYFIPLQAVIILSSLWAAKSRWSDEAQPETQP